MSDIVVSGPDGSTFSFPVGTPPDVISRAMVSHYARTTAPASAPDSSGNAGSWAVSDPLGIVPGGEPDASNIPDGKVARPMPFGEQMANVAGSLGRGADNLARMVANGATFGLADRAAAGMNIMTGQAPDYSTALKSEQDRTDQIKRDYPGAAAIGEGAGALMTGAGLVRNGVTLMNVARDFPALARYGLYGLEGAGYGAAQAAGHSRDLTNLPDVGQNALNGAETGFLLGAGLPAAASTAGAAYKAVSPFVAENGTNLSRRAFGLLGRTTDADAAGVAGLSNLGPEAMLADAGPSTRGLAGGVAAVPGEGRTALVQALEGRNAGTNARLAQDLTDNLGEAQSPVALTGTLLDARREITSPLYESALGDGAPAVETFRPLATVGLRLDKAVGGEKSALTKVRDMLQETGPDGLPVPVTDPAKLHAIKGEIDNMIEYGDPGLGVPAASLNREQGALKHVRRELNGALEDQVPGYREANERSAEYARLADAVENGTAVLTGGKDAVWPQDLAQKWNTMTPAERAAMREGVRADIENAVGTNPNDLAALKRKIGGDEDWNRLKMTLVYGAKPTDNVVQAIAREQQFGRTLNDVSRNSQTAARSAASGMIDEASQLPDIPASTTWLGVGGKVAQGITRRLGEALMGNRAEGLRDELGRALSAQGPDRDALVQALLQNQTTRNATAARIRAVGAAPGLVNAIEARRAAGR